MAKKKNNKQKTKPVSQRSTPAALGTPPAQPTPSSGPSTQIASAGVTRKLDLACGQTPQAGFEGVDVWPGAKHQVDLTQYPWTCHCDECGGVPFADNSVAELFCSHYIEHIEMVMLDENGKVVKPGEPGYSHAKDALFAFFDECYRILVPNGWLTIVCPTARSNRAFQDPTHRRFIVSETFQYLWSEWRRHNKLDHYNVKCDFGATVAWTVPTEVNAMSPEAQNMRFQHYWNSVFDWHVRLQACKPAR